MNLQKLYNTSFEEVFRSMQMLNFTVLYYDFDFDKDDLKIFNKNIVEYNDKYLDNKELFVAAEAVLLNEYQFNCEKQAAAFPFRAKIKMMKLPKTRLSVEARQIAIGAANHSINVFLVLALQEFVTGWGKTPEDVARYWERMLENAINYSNGMTDEFVVQYFKDQLNLDIDINK